MALQQLALGFNPIQGFALGFNHSSSRSRTNLRNRGNQLAAWGIQKKKKNHSGVGECRCQLGLGGAAAAGVVEMVEKLNSLVLGVGVGLPCQVMDCGDVVYRSTLPKQGLIITAPGVALALLVATYLWSQPGVAPGFWDMFVLAKLEQIIRPSYKKEDFALGKKIGEGAFGTVYKASLVKKSGKPDSELVVKKANEYGAVEVWMNERVRRACASSCADFIHGFRESKSKGKGEEFWLVWRYEGDATLDDLMKDKDFPYNVEQMIYGRVEELPKGPERENRIIRTMMRQIMSSLKNLHAIGIVHRDIKPQNIIFSKEAKTFKIIDLGAAADLRVGINYVPKEFLLDPRYAAPEQYIMSTQTPSAPPPPVAAALSPVLWQMNVPDRFDVYSAGLIFLQMVFSNLRSDSSLIQFNRQLKRCDYDIVKWRQSTEARNSPEFRRGFEILDLDDGVGWELLQAMIRFKGRQRISAKQALDHPYFIREGLLGLTFLQKLRLQLIRTSFQDRSEAFAWVQNLMAKSGTEAVGGFTEAELQNMKEKEPKAKDTIPRNALASALKLQRKVARTIATVGEPVSKRNWWNRWESKES
ncbi:hypothetical protein R1flu_024974 [Riccia fluitans]|uniref:non-specific serine/threonine protein kinase n=1 Tax=Riccia fluitans TaxID=41844 RepID=A0ABD1XWE9_9MARC